VPLTYYCWHCYAKNERPRGTCLQCGSEIASPAGTTFDDRLVWALGHPLVERRMVAARALGRRHVGRARQPLRRLVVAAADPYLAAAALEALVELDGADAHRELVDRLAGSGPAPLRRAARELAGRRRTGG
jgi:hypothetical protein